VIVQLDRLPGLPWAIDNAVMPINEEQQQRAHAGLQRLTTCPVCQAKRTDEPGFAFGDVIMAYALTAPDSCTTGWGNTGHTPMLQVICKVCNYVLLFAAPPLGLP
jgi:hypothetical protein